MLARLAAPRPGHSTSRQIRFTWRTRCETSPASAPACWCCSASSDSCRRVSARRPACTAPWAKGAAAPRRPSAFSVESCAMRPSATIARSRGIVADGRDQEWPAGVDFRRQRLVLRRHAAHGIADPAIDQRQPVVGPRLVDAVGKAVFEQRRVEQVAGVVAGEGPPGAVGALQARREADDQQPRRRRSPNDGTGALNQSGSRLRGFVAESSPAADRAGSRGPVRWQRGAGSGQPAAGFRSLLEVVVIAASGAIVVARCRNCGA